MGYFIAFLIIWAIFALIKAGWNLLFAPIFRWIGELIMGIFTSRGVSRIGARAILSIIVIIVLVWLFK